jgi:hypothetical protein
LFRVKVLGAALGALVLLALAGCGSSGGGGDGVERDADGLPVARVSARYATALAAGADTLAAAMDVTFAGEVIGTAEQREVALGQGSEAPLPVSVFLVRVDASSGAPAVGSTVRLEQLGGVTESAASDAGKVRVILDRDTPIAVGQSYVFVARQDGPETYSAAPFARFPVEDGLIVAPEGWAETGASRELSGATVAEAMEALSP